jgi:hypothetical protein
MCHLPASYLRTSADVTRCSDGVSNMASHVTGRMGNGPQGGSDTARAQFLHGEQFHNLCSSPESTMKLMGHVPRHEARQEILK